MIVQPKPVMHHGTMVRAMAIRVKFRKVDNDGNVIRETVHIRNLACHPKNRGGVYPAGVRCKTLCTEVFNTGFVMEEKLHQTMSSAEAKPG